MSTDNILLIRKPPPQIPLCVNCKHAYRSLADRIFFLSWRFAYCKLDSSKDDGDQYIKTGLGTFRFCSTTRKYGPCGPEGKLFQAK